MFRRNKVDNQITHDKLLAVLNVLDIVIFEDDFSVNSEKKAICYGIVRMSICNREKLFASLEVLNPVGKRQLEEFVNAFDKVFDAVEDWENEIPYNDIETAFKIIQEKDGYKDLLPDVEEKYYMINFDGWSEKEDTIVTFSSYGVGVDIPNLYEELFCEFIRKKAHWESFRIFRDFSATTQAEFEKYIEASLDINGVKVCILDDQLKNEKYATEITKCIEKVQANSDKRLNIIGLIYSSFDNKDCINEKIYFEYIKKGAPREEFQAALAKSSYSLMLSDLKIIYQGVLSEAFDEAVCNKNIAYYLSCMADCEGVTSYQVVTNWIKLLFEYKLSDIRELTKVAGLTRLIGFLKDEKLDFSKDMLSLNTFEAFDFSVNRYREPIASGDIFFINKKIYIVVGQDCDMMNSKTRKRKNGISEMVYATTIRQDSVDNAVKLNSQYMFVSNFRKNENDDIKILKIRYSSRELIENQILQLCQFNDDGKCMLDINEENYNASGVESEYYYSLHEQLVEFFRALVKIRKSEKESLDILVNNNQSGRLLLLTDYQCDQEGKGIIEYNARRICRLKHPYMLYLYKMYLEHQGRHPFDCMNMSRVQELQVPLKQNDSVYVTIDMVLTPDREMNRQHIEGMDWYIDISLLESTVSDLLGTPYKVMENMQNVEIKKEGTKFECISDSGERKNMCIKKIKDMLSIEEYQEEKIQ